MTIRATQAATLVLAGVESDIRATQAATLVLWGLRSDLRATQMAALVLGRRIPRRVIGVID